MFEERAVSIVFWRIHAAEGVIECKYRFKLEWAVTHSRSPHSTGCRDSPRYATTLVAAVSVSMSTAIQDGRRTATNGL